MKSKKKYHSETIDIFPVDISAKLELPVIDSSLSKDVLFTEDNIIDLNRELINNPNSTFCARVTDGSMKAGGFCNGDILIIDKSLTPANNSLIVCWFDSEFTLKKVRKINDDLYIIPDNPDYRPIKINPKCDFKLLGVVTYIVHKSY